MPLPSDEKLLALSQDLLAQFDTIFGLHPGFRPAHAKGVLLTGTFTPAATAAPISRAQHLNQPATPVVVRFSNSTGLPMIPDNDGNADPRGMAIRFMLAEHVHTDIVAHSADGFPTHTGAEFLELFRALAASDPAKIEGSPLGAYLATHPAALRYVQTPKPTPSSFARETYYGVTAMRFLNAAGEVRHGRYRIVPVEGNDFVSPDEKKTWGPDHLLEEIAGRVAKQPARFEVRIQVAGDGDEVNDATIHWPEDREVVTLGALELNAVADDNAAAQKQIIFDPIPRQDGIEPSDDPLLELRAAIYLMSGRRRRAA